MAQRATSLGPKPSLFGFFVFWVLVFFFALLSLFLIDKKPVFPLRKGHFLFIFNVSLSFSLNLFWPPLFLFPFLCLSVALFFLPSFLSFFFAFFLFLVFVSFFPYLSSLLLFHEKKNMKIFNCNLFSWNIFSFFWFPVLLFCFKSLFLIFAFSWF